MAWTQDGFEKLGVIESAEIHAIEMAVFNSMTFKTLINQSGNEPYGCARDIARDVFRASINKEAAQSAE